MSKTSSPVIAPAAAHTLSGSQRLIQSISALSHRNYRLYWFGQLSSVLAQNMEAVAQSWLVLELTNSPLLLGLTGLTFTHPDDRSHAARRRHRRPRRSPPHHAARATRLSNVFSAVDRLSHHEWVALWHVMVLAFFTGCVRAFDRPSRMALLPQMVPKEDIPNAVAIGGTIWQLNKLVGPAVAGMLIYLVGIGADLFLLLSRLSASAIVLWLAIRLEGQPAESTSRRSHAGHGRRPEFHPRK